MRKYFSQQSQYKKIFIKIRLKSIKIGKTFRFNWIKLLVIGLQVIFKLSNCNNKIFYNFD